MTGADLALEYRQMVRFVIENEDYSDEEERLDLISNYNDLAQEFDLENWVDL